MKCQIRWIDRNGFATDDTNAAICLAVLTITYPDGSETVRRYGRCAAHANRLNELLGKADRVFDDGGELLFTSHWAREQLKGD